MNILVETTGGGIFSLFTTAIQQVFFNFDDFKKLNNIDNIYIDINKNSYKYKKNIKNNPFDYVLDQEKIKPDFVLKAFPVGTYNDHSLLYGTPDLEKLKLICSKIRIKNTITNKINKEICENTLGVHVRLTDMIDYHIDLHGGGSTDDYLKYIADILKFNKVKNIFVASDNFFSLEKIKENFEIIYNQVDNISETEFNSDYCNYQIENIHKEDFWVDSFTDMLSLSKCGILLNKFSNLNNAALFFSKTLHKFYKI